MEEKGNDKENEYIQMGDRHGFVRIAADWLQW